MNFEIPAGLTDLLQDFTVAVLREKPTSLVQFAAEYFNNLNENKVSQVSDGNNKKAVCFGAGGSEDEPMQTDSEDEEPGTPCRTLHERSMGP